MPVNCKRVEARMPLFVFFRFPKYWISFDLVVPLVLSELPFVDIAGVLFDRFLELYSALLELFRADV